MPILRGLRKIGVFDLAQKEGFEPSAIYASTRLSTCFFNRSCHILWHIFEKTYRSLIWKKPSLSQHKGVDKRL